MESGREEQEAFRSEGDGFLGVKWCWWWRICSSHPVLAFCVISLTLLIFYLTVIGVVLQNRTRKGNALLFNGRFFLYYGTVSTLGIIHVLLFSLRPKNVSNTVLLCPVGRLVSFLLGVNWELRGGDFLDELAGRTRKGGEPRGAVFIGNHQSTLDALGLIHFWNKFHPMAAVIKKEVFYVWPFGLGAYLAGSIFIDRSRGKTAIYSIEASAHRSAKDRIKMFVFPEGTRNRNNMSWGGDLSERGLMPFKGGAFRAAISAGLPIIPVVFSPYTFVDEKRKLFGRGKAVIKILPEISTSGLTTEDLPALMEKAHKIMTEAYKSLTKDVLSDIPEDHLVISKKFK